MKLNLDFVEQDRNSINLKFSRGCDKIGKKSSLDDDDK